MSKKVITLGRLEIRFHWLVALAILISFAGLVRLGFWQMDRAQEKIAQQEEYQASGQVAATPIGQVPVAGRQYDLLQHQNRRVVMSGNYLNNNNIFLIYQNYEGQLGYEIITPLLLAEQEQIVLVSRGWSGINDIAELSAALPSLNGSKTIEGQLFIPSEKLAEKTNDSQNSDWPLLRRYINTAELSPLFEQPLFPYVVRLAEGQEGVLIRHWPQVVVDTGRNFSYALQWFSMALALLTVSLILSTNIRQVLSGKAPKSKAKD